MHKILLLLAIVALAATGCRTNDTSNGQNQNSPAAVGNMNGLPPPGGSNPMSP